MMASEWILRLDRDGAMAVGLGPLAVRARLCRADGEGGAAMRFGWYSRGPAAARQDARRWLDGSGFGSGLVVAVEGPPRRVPAAAEKAARNGR